MSESADATKNVVPIRKLLEPWEPLDLPSPRVNPAAVAILEDLLAIAKRGELHSITAIWTEPNAIGPNRSMAGVGGEWSNRHVVVAGLFGCATDISQGMWA